jgi:hypothetical protein
VLELYDIADGKTAFGDGDPQIVFCMDEFGPLSLLSRPGKQWAPAATKAAKGSDRAPRRRRRRGDLHACSGRPASDGANLQLRWDGGGPGETLGIIPGRLRA